RFLLRLMEELAGGARMSLEGARLAEKSDYPGFFGSLEAYARENGVHLRKPFTLVERAEMLQATTEGEIFVAIKDAGVFGPQAYWTYVEDPNAPRTQRAAKRSPRRPRGSENSGWRERLTP